MPSTMFDSAIFRDVFGTPAMRAIFSDETLVRNYVAVEVALAKAQGKLGVIPAEAAERDRARSPTPTRSTCPSSRPRPTTSAIPIVGVVHQMPEAVRRGRALPALGRHHAGHHGPVDGDAAARCASLIVDADLAAHPDGAGRRLTAKHRHTLIAGRTHMQHALPTTFGLKTAVWLAMVDRHRERLAQLTPRVVVGQFAGAAGTLASLGDKGLAVHDALMAELDLPVPTWPGTWRATASPRPWPSSGSSPAAWPRSPPTSC